MLPSFINCFIIFSMENKDEQTTLVDIFKTVVNKSTTALCYEGKIFSLLNLLANFPY